MIPELGHFALIIALCLALVQSVLPLIGAQTGNRGWMALAVPAAHGQFVFLLVSFACLTWAFVVNDFSVLYVASHSNSALPLHYRISAVWGAHEGSLLLWVLILSLWTVAVAVFSRSLPEAMRVRVIAVMGLISIGFLLFVVLTSNPFERLFPAAMDGRDLNPLLQDIGLILHPPMLYMGYVGFSVAFAFAIAALLGGQMDAAWARWSRPWTTVAWLFLTLGIALGSWWAYYELGWGGWWFWDPVENASFMPWLVGTALIHSLAVTEKRGAFKAWTLLLAISAFALSLLGTFLVRSGVLVSVHAFATDPTRGVFILAFLLVVIGGSLGLYAWRGPAIRSGGSFTGVSRETALLANNVLFVVAMLSVLLGTLYPLLIDALGGGKLSVGPPYFDAIFVPLMLPMAILAGIGPLLRWKQDAPLRVLRELRLTFIAAILLGVAFLYINTQELKLMVLLGVCVAFWVMGSAAQTLWQRLGSGGRLRVSGVPLGFYGMSLAHFGLGVFIIGVTLVSNYTVERDVRMTPGDRVEIGDYSFMLDKIEDAAGPNYQTTIGTVRAFRDERQVATLYPEKRIYRVQGSPMTEAGIDPGFTRDLFVALGEPLSESGDGEAWAVRVYYKPYIRWIWVGALFMTLGGALAASDRRYRLAVRSKASVPVGAGTQTA
jgi:cytochrome c-type biogenesis protein CcmF